MFVSIDTEEFLSERIRYDVGDFALVKLLDGWRVKWQAVMRTKTM